MNRLLENGLKSVNPRGYQGGQGWLWWALTLLPAAAGLFVVGITTMNDRLLAIALQPAYAWAMALGLIGLCARFCSRPSPFISWMADASYWMYLVHVPLVMMAQLAVRSWAIPAEVKFLVVMAMVMPVLMLTYRYGVRFTAIGSVLNGRRGGANEAETVVGLRGCGTGGTTG